MEFTNWPSLIFLLLLLVFISRSVFRARGRQLTTSLRQASIWGVIFGVAIGAALWYDRSSQSSYLLDDGTSSVIELRKRFDGHFHIVADINGAPIPFIVDTGASQLVLSRADAEAAGINVTRLTYSVAAQSANGVVQTAPVLLDTVSVGPLTDTNVRAVVNSGDMNISLLGMSYLSRFASIEIAGNRLILRR